jgi:hypothetical protein
MHQRNGIGRNPSNHGAAGKNAPSCLRERSWEEDMRQKHRFLSQPSATISPKTGEREPWPHETNKPAIIE